MPAAPKAVTGKRKRPAVSYVEKDDVLDALIKTEDVSDRDNRIILDEDDDAFVAPTKVSNWHEGFCINRSLTGSRNA